MKHAFATRRFFACFFAALGVFALNGQLSRQSDTVAVLTEALRGELHAHQAYLAYSKKAVEEKYVRIGELFTALAVSEAIHARNFSASLAKLGAPSSVDVPEITVSDTRTNLKNATENELQEIDVKYPAFIKRVTAEGQDAAAKGITYAWQAEKQHRDLVTRLQMGASSMFGLVVKSVEGTKVTYYVCKVCGSTLIELPKFSCPNCGNPVSNYTLVEGAGP